MKLLIDACLSLLWVEFLRDHGIEARHWAEIGDPAAPDEVIFTYAEANGWTVLTHDLDFGSLLSTRRARFPSVIRIRAQDVMPAAMGPVVLRALRFSARYLETGALVTVDLLRSRVRVLPIRQ